MKRIFVVAALALAACGGTERDVAQPLAGTWFAFIGTDVPQSNATIELADHGDESFEGSITFASVPEQRIPRIILPAKVPAASLSLCVTDQMTGGCQAELLNAHLTGRDWSGVLHYADGRPDAPFVATR